MNKDEYMKMFEAEDRHWWYKAVHDLVLTFIEKEHGTKGPLEIFDAGCGTGRLCQLMSEFGDVRGCDISETAITLCNERRVYSAFQTDLDTFNLEQCRYDVITSIDVLYHRAVRSDQEILRKLFTGLKPGGILILQVPAFDSLRSGHDIAVHTARRYTKKQVGLMLGEAGFQTLRITYRVTALFLPIVIYRIARRGFSGTAKVDHTISSDVSMPPRVLNSLFSGLLRLENRMLLKFSLPFGTSVFAVARKQTVHGGTKGIHAQ